MKEIIQKYEISAGFIRRFLFALLWIIFVGHAMIHWSIQILNPLSQWGEYTLYLTLLLSLTLITCYSSLNFLTAKTTRKVRSSSITYNDLNNLIATSSVILFSMQVVKDQLYPEWISDNIEAMLGYTKQEAMQPDWWLKNLHPQDKDRVIRATVKLFQGELVACDYRFMHKNGSEVWIHDEQRLVYDEQGKLIRVVNTWADVTRQKIALLQQGATGHVFKLHEVSLSTDVDLFTSRINPDIEDSDINSLKPVNLTDDIDFTDRNEMEERIRILAFYDPLTNLPNRRLLLESITQAISASETSRRHGALLFMDLDRFKILNDTYGHNIGDLLLLEVTRRLQINVREGDTIARLGDDEFVVMFNSLDQYASKAETQAKKLAEKIRVALAKPYHLPINLGQPHDFITYHSSVSIGVVLFLGKVSNTEELMKYADLAMYEAKHSGRDAVCVFDPGMQTDLLERSELETEMHQALLEKQFVLYFQPQVDSNGFVTGSEALVRWRHPRYGMVSPAKFIPLAEENGLILPLGQWVLETACIQLANWATRPETVHLTMAVNVSAHQFRQDDFVDQVLEVLERTGASPYKLKLELTESMLVANVEDIIMKMIALKAKGVGFSLDDFGTGYSSLSYLKRLPLDQLKIDQGFVRDILIDANDAAISQMVVALAESMGLSVIAEGVESEEQLGFLQCQGCHAYQGYLFSQPLPIEQFDDFVGQSHSK